jgi:CheY-like chemotaxis protein
VAHSIIKQHDGQIQITSEPDVGTTVRFWLPTSGPPLETDLPAQVLGPQDGVRILVMDDDPVVSEVAEMMLARLGFTVTTTSEGGEAVRVFDEARNAGQAFHLVLLDMTVPGGMGGLETLQALRRLDPEVRAIGTSGYSGQAALGSLQDHGFTAALPKPFTLADMRGVLAEALGGQPLLRGADS